MIRILALCCSCLSLQLPTRKSWTGSQAFGDWRSDRPGVQRRINPPPNCLRPMRTRSASSPTRQGQRPANLVPQAPTGFKVELIAQESRGRAFFAPRPMGRLRG